MSKVTTSYIKRFFKYLRGYLGYASTAMVTFIVAWAAQRGVDIDATWLQVVFVGAFGLLVGLLERLTIVVADRIERLSWVRHLVTIIRLGQPLPSYTKEP